VGKDINVFVIDFECFQEIIRKIRVKDNQKSKRKRGKLQFFVYVILFSCLVAHSSPSRIALTYFHFDFPPKMEDIHCFNIDFPKTSLKFINPLTALSTSPDFFIHRFFINTILINSRFLQLIRSTRMLTST